MCIDVKNIINSSLMPRHLAIIMDGNGRWATNRFLPRKAGHLEGVKTVSKVIDDCLRCGIKYLTLFAFSSENWKRPITEVSILIEIFINVLKSETNKMIEHDICFHVIGDLAPLNKTLTNLIIDAENKTINNNKLHLTLAINYGGRWDILQAVKAMILDNVNIINDFNKINEKFFSKYLAMSWAPDPDLIIRTGGEQRISNFLIWNFAYTELYFVDKFWPEFNSNDLELAFNWYSKRKRRFGGIDDNTNNK